MSNKFLPGVDICDQVLAVLPEGGPGIHAREAHRLVGCWAPGTIRRCLAYLASLGRIEMEKRPHGPGERAFFWRAAETNRAAND